MEIIIQLSQYVKHSDMFFRAVILAVCRPDLFSCQHISGKNADAGCVVFRKWKIEFYDAFVYNDVQWNYVTVIYRQQRGIKV